MQVKTSEIKQALGTTKYGLDKDGLVYFNGKHIVVGNDQIIIHYPFETDFAGGVAFNDLSKFIDAIAVDDLDIKLENKQLLISAGLINGGFKMVSYDNNFSLPDEFTWEKLPKDFVPAVTLCAFSASVDSTMGLLTCLKIGKKTVVSSDNFRVSKYTFDKPMKNEFMLTLSTIAKLIKFTPLKVFQDNAYAYFILENGTIFSCRKAVGDYPDIDGLFELENGETFDLPVELKGAVKSVEFMSDKENPYDSFVTVFTEENQLKVNAENERGWSSYIVGDFDKDIKFKVNPAFLYEIMDKVGTITLGTDKALFETDNFKHVMALPI